MSSVNRLGDTDEATIFQWFLDLPSLNEILNWPIQVNLLSQSGIKLHTVSKDSNASASDVAQAWREFSAAIGPTVTFNVLNDEHWRELVPVVDVPSGDTHAVVWQGDKQDVVCRVVFDEHGNGIRADFHVEDR